MDESSGGSREDSVLGRRLGPYVLRRRIAAGGMGTVFDAYHERLEREVALKTLGSGDASRDDLARFLNEARAAARLNHPNLVSVFDVGEHNGTRYLAMELVRGRSLYDRIRNEGALEPREALELVAAACDGLQHAHDKGILHRDLKPANILLQAPEGTPRITDFGVARAPGNQRLTATGIALGTPNYMSPEQAMGQNDTLDARSDVWGMGAVLYEALTGLPPFNRASQLETMQAVVGEALVPPRQHRPEIPEDYEAIVLRCLAKPRDRRYRSAFDLSADLRRALRGEALTSTSLPPPRSSKALVRVLGATVVVAATLGAFLAGAFVSRRGTSEPPTPTPTPTPDALTLESYLQGRLDETAAASDDATLASLEGQVSLSEYLRLRGEGIRVTREAWDAATAPLRAELAWRRSEQVSGPASLGHLARAAQLDPAGPRGLSAWRDLAGRLLGTTSLPSRLDMLQALRIYRFLSRAGSPGAGRKDGKDGKDLEVAARLSLNLLDFQGAQALLDPPPADPDLAFLARFSADLAGQQPLSSTVHVFARSSLGPCLVSAREQGLEIRAANKHALLGWHGRPSALAAADVSGDANDEVLCAENQGGVSTLTLLGLGLDPKTQIRKSIGRFSGTCFGLTAGDVDGDDNVEFLVLAGVPAKISLLQVDRATRRVRTRLVFPVGEAAPGHWDRGLLLNLDGQPGDEILLASSRPGAKVLARRAKGVERSSPAAEVDLGPVSQLLGFRPSAAVSKGAGTEDSPQENALALVPGGPQAGIVVLGAGPAGLLEILQRWPLPADITSPETLRVTVFETSTGQRLVLRAYQAGRASVLDATPLAQVEAGDPRPVEVFRTQQDLSGPALLIAGSGNEDAGDELVLARSLLGASPLEPAPVQAVPSAPEAYVLLHSIGEAASAEAFAQALTPALRGKADLAWLRLLAERGKTSDGLAAASFALGNPKEARAATRQADALYRSTLKLAEELSSDAGSLSPTFRWQARSVGLTAASRLEDWAAAARLAKATPAERQLAGDAITRWQFLAAAQQTLQVEDYDLGDPARRFGVSFPARSPLRRGAPTRLGIDSHAEEAVSTELELEPSGLVEVQFDFDLQGVVSSGSVQAGLLEKRAGQTLTTGIELWLYNTTRPTRAGYLRFVVGGQSVSAWVEIPQVWGRLKGRLRAELGIGASLVSHEVSLDGQALSAYRGRVAFSYSLPRRVAFGVVAPANPNGYREDPRFARRGAIEIHRLSLGVLGHQQVTSLSEPQAALGTLARGETSAALAEFSRALLTLREADPRALAFLGRALAHARLGNTGSGLADLVRAFEQAPLRVVWWLELAAEDLRGPDALLVQTFLARLEKSGKPVLVSASRSLRGDLWADLGAAQDKRYAGLAGYLKFRRAHLPTAQRYKDSALFRQYVGQRRLQLPWETFPAVASPVDKPLREAKLSALLTTKGTILKRYVAYSEAAQGRPELAAPQLKLAEVFSERNLFGDALAALRRARELAPLPERPAIDLELAVVLARLNELPLAAESLQAARAGGVKVSGLAGRLPLLARDPRYRALFR